MITVYFIMVGEFFTDNFNYGPNRFLLWPLFICCNFILSVIFMNMLIAIMGQTYEEVSATKLQSELEQKIALISDYFDLVNLQKVFRDKKYVIHCTPAQTDTIQQINLEEEIEDLGNNLTKAFNHKIDEVEHTLKGAMRSLNIKTSQIQRDMIGINAQTEDLKKTIDSLAVLDDQGLTTIDGEAE